MIRKAIVTGANGFLGKAVVQELASHNIGVYAIVRRESRHVDELQKMPGVCVKYCDMNEYSSLVDKISDKDVDIFYHFAWTGTSGNLRENDKVQLQNIAASCDAVRVSKLLGCSRFIFAASVMQYEIAALEQTNKVVPCSSIYCTAKITADFMCRALADSLGIWYISAVISNVYGPGEISERLINTSIRKLLSGVPTSFSSGEQLYDFIYIDDAARMFAAIGEPPARRKKYYIGNQSPRQLRDFLLEMRDVVAPEAELGLDGLPFGGISLTYREFNTSAIYEDTACTPEVSFAEGIRRTAAWIRDSLEVG